MIQWILAIWSLVPLTFLNPACSSASSQFMHYWSLAWRILSITLRASEMSTLCVSLNTLWHYPSLGFNTRDLGSILGSERSPEEGNGSPLQYSCLENPMDRGAWQTTVHRVAKGSTWLSDFSLSLGLEWKLTFSTPVATAKFSKFTDILKAPLSQHQLL